MLFPIVILSSCGKFFLSRQLPLSYMSYCSQRPHNWSHNRLFMVLSNILWYILYYNSHFGDMLIPISQASSRRPITPFHAEETAILRFSIRMLPFHIVLALLACPFSHHREHTTATTPRRHAILCHTRKGRCIRITPTDAPPTHGSAQLHDLPCIIGVMPQLSSAHLWFVQSLSRYQLCHMTLPG